MTFIKIRSKVINANQILTIEKMGWPKVSLKVFYIDGTFDLFDFSSYKARENVIKYIVKKVKT